MVRKKGVKAGKLIIFVCNYIINLSDGRWVPDCRSVGSVMGDDDIRVRLERCGIRYHVPGVHARNRQLEREASETG